jgi:hypothetical protein
LPELFSTCKIFKPGRAIRAALSSKPDLVPFPEERAEPSMYQNNKKTILSRSRWAEIVGFIHENEADIKTRLLSAIHPEMIRADLMLDNVIEGTPALSPRTILPNGGSTVYVCSLVRPKWLFPKMLSREIQDLSIEDFLIFIANQVEVL